MMPPEEAVAALLETVHFSQQLVLFAPHAVAAPKHVPMLRSRITSPQPALRAAAARSLRHLAERDPGSLLPTGKRRSLDIPRHRPLRSCCEGTLQETSSLF